MGRLKLISQIACLLSVTFVTILYFSKKDSSSLIETDEEIKKPSYNHSLKIGNKVLRSYRSPAAIIRENVNKSSLNQSSSGLNPIDNQSASEGSYSESGGNHSEKKSKRKDIKENVDDISLERARDFVNESSSQGSVPSVASTPSESSQAAGGGAGFFPAVDSNSEKTSDKTNDNGLFSSRNKSREEVEPFLKGRVKPLAGVITTFQMNPFISSAYASNACINPRILLFDLLDMSVLLDNPISDSMLSGETKFEFNPKALGLNINAPSRYLLQTRGCTTNFKRIITSFYYEQDIDLVTTLVSSLINTESAQDIAATSASELNKVYTTIISKAGTVNDFNTLFDLINQTPSLSEIVSSVISPDALSSLTEAAPDVNSVTYVTALSEKGTYDFKVDSTHWNSNYIIGYEWQIDGVTVSTDPDWVYVPTADSPSNLIVTLITGKKDPITGGVDTTVPYHEVNWDVTIQDSFPVTSPIVALNSTVNDPSATRNVSIDLTTGNIENGKYKDCETFTSFAITENDEVPTEEDFVYSCSSGPLQGISYTVKETSDGPLTIKFWSKDNQGVISSLPSTLDLVIDTTAPVIDYPGFPSGFTADDTHTFTWNLTEAHASSSQNFLVEFFNGTSWVTAGNVSLTDGPHVATAFSTSFTFPNIDVANAKFKITYADTLGQETIAESPVFSIQRPLLGSTPGSIDAGSVLNKSLSAVTNFSFTNTGSVPSKTCSPITITGVNASEFSLVTNNCAGSVIPAGGSCSMGIRATPQSKGARTATLNLICGNDNYSTTVSLSSLNNPPVTVNRTNTTFEDNHVFITLGQLTDTDGDTLSYTIMTNPASGIVDNCYVSGTDYICRYSPNADFHGTDSFTFRSNDGTVNSNTSTGTITVVPLNDAPVLSGTLALTLLEDTTHNFNLIAGFDIDGDTLTYTVVTGPASGTLTCPVSTSVSCSYTPSLNFNGNDSFSYRVTDGTLNSSSLTVSISVTPVNDAPLTAASQTFTTRDNFAFNFTIDPGNDVDTAQGSLRYRLVSSPAVGTLSDCLTTGSYTTDRTCIYTAPVNFHGAVSFTYLVNDGFLDSVATSTITINVQDQTSTTPSLSPVNFTPTVPTINSPLTLTAAGCSDISFIMIQESSTAPTAASSGWQSCTTAAAALIFNPSTSNQQGFRTLRIYGRDLQDNISAPQLVNFIYDSMAPQIAIESIPTLPNGIAYPIKWNLTEASVSGTNNFTLQYSLNGGSSWTTVATIPVGQDGPHTSTPYTYNWNIPGGTYPSAYFRISLTDNTNQTGTSTSNNFQILVDLNAPNLLAGEMKINGSTAPSPTPQKYVNVSLKAIDNDTNISHFCLKTDSATPSGSDSCWRAVDAPQPGLTPATTLNLTNFPFLLGFVPGVYTVYAWTRDLSGNISHNTNTAGQDKVVIEYFSDTPPLISNFFVSNTPTPPNPISGNEMIFDNSDPVIIKWRAIDDKGILPTIKLYYTTNDSVWNEIATGVSNGVNNCNVLDEPGTTLDDFSTGCYSWTSPVSQTQYFKVQIIIEDNAHQATSMTSLPLNSTRFKVLAGNVDPGVSSSAKSAIIATPYLYSLAVASDGKVFVRDSSFGLMYINPQTGIYEQLLRVTGSSTGDNGPVRSAGARRIDKITMDYQDRLIILDYDRIRRIDTRSEPMTIETIIGAANNGAAGTQATDIVTDPQDLRIHHGAPSFSILQPLPNGDIYFQSGPYGTVNGGNTLRIYRGSLPTPSINTIRISGSGTFNDFNGVLSMTDDTLMSYHLNFNVNTSAISKIMAKLQRYPVGCSFFSLANIDTVSYTSTPPHPPGHVSTCGDWASRTGNDGRTYHLNNQVAWAIQISRYDAASNTNIRVLGSGAQGICSDGTPATSCNSNINDIFVTATGKIFFIDNGLVRVVDDSGNVQTLYGQTKTFGDYGLAQDARFNHVPYIGHGVGDDVILYDASEKILREIRPNNTSQQVYKLAGNGQTGAVSYAVPAASQTLNGASWNQPGTLASNPNDGTVYFPCTWGVICKLNRLTGLWEPYAGQGEGPSIHWTTPGPALRNEVRLGGYTPTIFAYHSGRMVTGSYEWSGQQPMNSALRELNESTGQSTFLAGKVELDGASGCPNGDGNNCNLAAARSEGRAVTWHTGLGVWLYEYPGNVLRTLSTSGEAGTVGTFTTMPEAVQSMVWNGSVLYYCNDSGLLKKIDFSNSTVSSLPFPVSGIRCYGYNLLYKNASGAKPARLVFPFSQNGLTGIGEYYWP